MAVAAALVRQFAGLHLPFPRKLLHTEPVAGFDLLWYSWPPRSGTPRPKVPRRRHGIRCHVYLALPRAIRTGLAGLSALAAQR